MKKPELDQLLSEWKMDIPENDPSFTRAVWTRIAAEEASVPAVVRWISRLAGLFTIPQIAIPAAVAAVVITASLAAIQGQHRAGKLNSELAREYRRSINPIALVEVAALRGDQL